MPSITRFHNPWLKTVSDDDLDVLCEAVEHLEDGGNVETLSPVVQARLAVLDAEYAAWHEQHIGGPMNSDAMKRLETLEAQHRRWSLEPYAQELAEQQGLDVDELIDEAGRILQRIDAVGEDRAYAELAAEWGITVEELRAEAAALA